MSDERDGPADRLLITTGADVLLRAILHHGIELDDTLGFLLSRRTWTAGGDAGAYAETVWDRRTLLASIRLLDDGRREVVKFVGPAPTRIIVGRHPEYRG